MTGTRQHELRAQEATLLDAMQAHDVDTLSRLFDREYVYTSDRGEVWGRERALQDFGDPAFSLGQLEVELERTLQLADAGVVTGRSRVTGTVRGVSVSGVYRFTRVWRRLNGEWTILATHISLVGAE
jgi:ketosteroid isomerase-like protein